MSLTIFPVQIICNQLHSNSRRHHDEKSCCGGVFFHPFGMTSINPRPVTWSTPRFVLPGVAESFSTTELMTVSGQNFHGRAGRRKSALGGGGRRGKGGRSSGWSRLDHLGGEESYPTQWEWVRIPPRKGSSENHRLKRVKQEGICDPSKEGT